MALLLQSCRDDLTIGKNLIPGSDYLSAMFTDSLTLFTKTVREDSLNARDLSQYMLGAMTDEVFGKTFSAIYSQVRLSTAGISFNDTAYVDSAVLSIPYAAYYGDRNAYHFIRVYRLTDTISSASDKKYFSNQTFPYNSTPVGQRLHFSINADSSFTEDNVKYSAAMRIRLNNALGQEILNQTADGAFKSNTDFKNYFKGLLIAPDTAYGFAKGMLGLSVRSDQSFLIVYYHTPNTTGKKLRLPLNGNAVNVNYHKHNYSGTIVNQALNNNAVLGDSLIYVQSMSGVKGKITLPYIQNLGRILVNKAEIEITRSVPKTDDDTLYKEPSQMLLLAADSTGKNALIPDQLLIEPGQPYYGGKKMVITNADGNTYIKYKFSIAAQLQLIIDQKKSDYGFYLLTFPSNQLADRVVIGGGNRNGDNYQMKLNLSYTKIN
jgi:hypothetical protein